ncbi:STAS-domain containing protein [Ferriphaselus amnicola]|uniref:Anti-sigma factor antagonist n=1 Tax=Ferriphaselus amnicola TaxID=1188319 RepID=A0A2Z6GA98_9PROT|nr:STAS domain-containing protein [Ferriphaselus amnicola]BBE50215.1 STAS-domain containing protein [Ferriphaselus amnicola]
MQTSVLVSGGIATVDIMGRFDFSAHRGFKEAYDPLLSDGSVTSFVIDLSGVDYMDSSALGMLLMLRERAQAVNKKVTLSRPNHTVSQILDIANFAKLFPISK